MLKLFILLACFILSSCMVGPNYKEPPKDIEEHWLKTKPPVKQTQVQNANWWNAFHDPILTKLILLGYQHNLTLQSTGVSVLQARAQLAQAVGDLYPQQQLMTGAYTFIRPGGSQAQGLLPNDYLSSNIGFNASWELDFWGKYRRAIQSNNALFLASVAAYDSALVTLTADIATTFIQIRTAEELIKVTRQNIAVQTMSLKIANARYTSGETSLLDVQQAKTQLAQTQSTLPGYVSNLQTQKDALAVLLGTTPDKIDALIRDKKYRGIPRVSSVVSVGIPKEVIARRPDVYQSRMQAIAQLNAIGAVKAQLYPSLSLTGEFLFASNSIGTSSISDMFDWSNRAITAGPSLAWSLLNYGQITNAVRVQDATFQQALLSYLNLVLKVQQEVQDNITQYLESRNAAAALARANNSAIKGTNLSLIRYKEGEAIYTTVLNSEQQQLSVQVSLVNARANVAQSLVSLYRSLGGGWQIRGNNDVVPDSIKAEMAARTNWGSLLKQQNHLPPVTNKQKIKQQYLPAW
ncbi:efflux transporter outer membrane subunit [Legionella waltersii]|uniref:Outer membrane efflux protein n=1 Tax=Legionella waltersii TaxID=66969 RepID=A0A0W1ABN4_9GAMM|nr:efflux transporter outer membrane subunit [Legionella waltersii]KTD78762.1 outer membrane efflux protein [Legionella waltersii]SNV11264.1 outer membrane efflux protein [Legionella waltersii]